MSERDSLLSIAKAAIPKKEVHYPQSTELLQGLQNNSVMFLHWKTACTAAWSLFIIMQYYLWYDRTYSVSPLCSYSDEDYGGLYWYIIFAVFGGFAMIWMALVVKFFLFNQSGELVPVLMALNIVSMGSIATLWALFIDEGGVCVDVLGVASPATIWVFFSLTKVMILSH